HQDLRIQSHGAGKGDQLPLTAGEGGSALDDGFVVTPGEPADEGVGLNEFGRLHHLFIGDVRVVKADVAFHVPDKEKGILEDEADFAAQLPVAVPFQGDAVDQDFPALHRVEAEQEVAD